MLKNIVIDNQVTTYQINEDGKCFNTKTGKWLIGQENYKNHYWSVNLTLEDGSKKRVYLHRLVALNYVENDDPINKVQVNHIDGDKSNNHYQNLEWVTPQQNTEHMMALGLKKLDKVYCFDEDLNLIQIYRCLIDVVKDGFTASVISHEINSSVKTLAYGMYWSKEPQITQIKNYINTGKSKIVYQYDLQGNFIQSFPSTGEAAKAVGSKYNSHIGECCRGKIKTYKGYIWRYEDDIVSTSDESQREVLNVTS